MLNSFIKNAHITGTTVSLYKNGVLQSETAGVIDTSSGEMVDKTTFHWGNNPCSHAFAAIDIDTGDAVVSFVNCENGPNIFKPITGSVLGDMSPVFDWLGIYCGFNAVIQPMSQQVGQNLLLFSKNQEGFPELPAIHEGNNANNAPEMPKL